ncbi:hypothetical protein CPB86DRAFT_829661 [Serendipita vermifera]|nr:hypothetical protein CPB86DRAFT_829661 [Serendipita vermifera]
MSELLPFAFADSMKKRSSWDAPPEVKGTVAFHAIFSVANAVSMVLLTRYLRHIPPWLGRGPYIYLAFLSLILVLGNVVSAVYTRFSDEIPRDVRLDLSVFLGFLMETDMALAPAAVLYLIHVRGIILERSQTKDSFRPAMSHLWKMIFDWSVTGVTYIVWMTFLGYTSHILRRPPRSQYLKIRQRLLDAACGLNVALYCIVVLSLVFMVIQIKTRKLSDRVITRLVFTIPFFLILMVDRLAFIIMPRVRTQWDADRWNLSIAVIQGVARIGIAVDFLWTMARSIWQQESTPSLEGKDDLKQLGNSIGNGSLWCTQTIVTNIVETSICESKRPIIGFTEAEPG